jgi:hypothetical protein
MLWTITLFSSSMRFIPQVFGGFLPWPFHHVVDIGPKYKYWTFNLCLKWTTHLGKTSSPPNRGCEFCDQRCAHLGWGNCEKSGGKSCWIFYFKVVVSFSFTWCHGSIRGGFPSTLGHILIIKAQYRYPKNIGFN